VAETGELPARLVFTLSVIALSVKEGKKKGEEKEKNTAHLVLPSGICCQKT